MTCISARRILAAGKAGRPEWFGLPASNQAAMGSTSRTYFTGKACPKGHISVRERGRGGHCKVCEETWRVSPKNKRSNAKRRANELNAQPSWLSDEHLDAIASTFKEAQRLEEITGERHHVDHVVPLTHPLVCGLHVPWNLKVLSATDSLRKGNAFDGTMDNDGWRRVKGARV